MNELVLHEKLVDTSVRYEQKTAAINQTALILLRAQIYSSENEEMEANFQKLDGYLSPYDLSIDHFFAGMLLTNLISEVENFLVDVTQSILIRYPKKLGSLQFKLSEIIDKSQQEIVNEASEQFLNKIMYKKANEYLSEFCEILSIDAEPLQPLWPYYVEAKARRDLGIHNKWIVNSVYHRKISEVGLDPADYQGPQMCPDHYYLVTAMDQCDLIIRKISDLLVKKYPHPENSAKDA